MNIYASYVLHYGKEWLLWSMRSIAPFVDGMFVFYTPEPSHGHTSGLKCPETRGELHEIASVFDVKWYDGVYKHEGEHRDFAVETCLSAG